MSAKFFDLRVAENPENGKELIDGEMARAFLKNNAGAQPFIADLISDQQTKLTFGLGSEVCCAQFSTVDDEPPYLFAKLESESKQEGIVDFWLGNEPTEIERRLCMPLSVLLEVAAYFVETGKRSPLVSWEEV